MNHQQEIHQFNESHFRKFDLSQHIVMMVVGDNVVCIGLYGVVNNTPRRCTLNEAIGIENNTHYILNLILFFFLLLAKPLMQVHFINLIKSLLVKDTLIPKSIQFGIKFLGIIITHKLLDVIQLISEQNTK